MRPVSTLRQGVLTGKLYMVRARVHCNGRVMPGIKYNLPSAPCAVFAYIEPLRSHSI